MKQNLEVEIIDITPEIEILNKNDKEKFNQVEDKLIPLSKNLTCIDLFNKSSSNINNTIVDISILCNPCSP